MAVDCPYCGEPKTATGLRGHVQLVEDGAHGPRGTVPDDFEAPEGDASVVDIGSADIEVSEAEDDDQSVLELVTDALTA